MTSYTSGPDADLKMRLHTAMLKLYPFLLAISFTIKEENRTIKNEYLLSQCLMRVIKDVGIDGIAYLSAQVENVFQYPHSVNLTIPTCDISKDNQYSKYCKMFKISKPVMYDGQIGANQKSYIDEIYTKYDPYGNEKDVSKVTINGRDVFYGETEYGRFDDNLCAQ